MNKIDFCNSFSKSIADTLQAMTSKTADISFSLDKEAQSFSIDDSFASIEISTNGKLESKLLLLIPVSIASYICDVVFGGEGDTKHELDEDDLSSIGDLIKTSLESLSENLSTDIKFKMSNSKFYKTLNELGISSYKDIYQFSINLDKQQNNLYLVVPDKFANYFADDNKVVSRVESDDLPSDEQVNLNNLELVKDVKLFVKVRIGSKTMLLRDIISMDIGSVVELDRLVSDSLDIIVDEKIVGKGEVVVIDGNFGIQITKMFNIKNKF
jgi:flagellar motor switch protein FliN/FliY